MMVFTAVAIAKNEQIKTLSVLKTRLEQLYPGENDEIDEAIQFMADSIVTNQGLKYSKNIH